MNHPAPDAVTALLELGAHLAAQPGRLPADLTPTDLTRALGHVKPAQHLVDTATLSVLGAARAHGLAWPHIGAALGLSDSGARDLYKRLRTRHPDYTQPLAPTLQAHRTRAWELLTALDGEVSPGTAGAAAPRLGAVLLAAALTGADDARVRSWLADDTLTGVWQVLNPLPGGETVDACEVLRQHARDGAGMRTALVDLMRRALPAPDPEPGPTWAVTGPHAAATLETGDPAPANTPNHTLDELREHPRAWLRALPEPVEEADARAAERLLAATLFAALSFLPTWDRALAHVPAWLEEDTLAGPLAVLEVDPSPRTCPARTVLATHAQTDAPTRARLIALMRAALEAGLVTGENPEAGEGADQDDVDGRRDPGQEPSAERDGSGALPTATAPVKLDSGPAPERRPGYARPLERAGLSPAAADALADPLTRLIAETTLLSHREVHPQTRHLMEALQPTLLSQNPARVRTLLYLLPRLDLYGLEAWAPLALAIGEHAPHLEQLPSAADPLRAADLPTHLAHEVDALVNIARRALVASWAPTAPVWEAGPALERLTAAVEGGQVDHLADALEAVAELDQTVLGQDTGFGAHQLRHHWETLAYAWRRARTAPSVPAQPSAELAEEPGLDPDQADTPPRQDNTWSQQAAHLLPEHPALAAALAELVQAVGGPSGVQELAGLASDQRPYMSMYRLVRAVNNTDLDTEPEERLDLLDEVLQLKPTRAPFGRRHPDGARALAELQRVAQQAPSDAALTAARPTTPAPTWTLLATPLFPTPAMAEAVAHLLETSGPLLHTGALGTEQTHRALSALRLAVLQGRTAGLGTVLDDVLKLKPTDRPIKDHPQVAAALTALIRAYDHQ